MTTGLGPVYDGVVHVFASPADLLALLMVGALGGMNGAVAGRCVLFVLAPAWLAAGLVGMSLAAAALETFAWVAPVASLLVLGVLVALDRSLPTIVIVLLAVMVGVMHGGLNGVGLAEAARERSVLLGIVASVFVSVALVAGGAVSLRRAWARMLMRVIGSWVAAIGLLLLGWTIRTGAS